MANTPVRTFRVDEYTWKQIQEIAKKQGTTASAVVLTIIKKHIQSKGN